MLQKLSQKKKLKSNLLHTTYKIVAVETLLLFNNSAETSVLKQQIYNDKLERITSDIKYVSKTAVSSWQYFIYSGNKESL
jgi:hypothetical protein